MTLVEGLVMRGERIVIAEKLQKRVIQIAHEGHQGIVRTKQMLRAHVWFPGIDAAVEKHVGRCIGCSGEASPAFGHAMQIFLCSWTEKTINF